MLVNLGLVRVTFPRFSSTIRLQWCLNQSGVWTPLGQRMYIAVLSYYVYIAHHSSISPPVKGTSETRKRK